VEILKIYPNQKTPMVVLDPNTGHMLFEGNCNPENVIDFMQPVERWIDDCLNNIGYIADELVVDFRFRYYNTASYKYFLRLLKKIKTLIDANKRITFLWYYENDDEDGKEAGEDLFELAEIPDDDFELIEMED